MPTRNDIPTTLQELPFEVQVRTFTYLRAVDLSAIQQLNRHYWKHKRLHHAIVMHFAEQVYPSQWTEGFEKQPTSKTPPAVLPKSPHPRRNGKARSSSLGSIDEAKSTRSGKGRSSSLGSIEDTAEDCKPAAIDIPPELLYDFENLRNMELLVVARLLNSPEPATGFVVSRSWCKKMLGWLEDQQERHQPPQEAAATGKKKKAKKVKKKQRKGEVPPPPQNANSDITCVHNQLQHSTSSRSARARRRLLDKKAWKILKALYPESYCLPTNTGECLLCQAEKIQAQKQVTDDLEAKRNRRKMPLKDPAVRRFYTRTRGIPEQCLRNGDLGSSCPLVDGSYYVLPRAWCHGWRRFMKTGEGGNTVTSFPPPDCACLLCDLHRFALMPPHLEAFLYGESSTLLESTAHSPFATLPEPAALVPGQSPSRESLEAMRSLGLSPEDVARQMSAMRSIESQQRRQLQHSEDTLSRNELLDRENHVVVEILAEAEFRALEMQWPSTFVLRFTVNGSSVDFSTPACRSCDVSGRQCSLSIRNRSRVKRPERSGSVRLEY